MKTEITELLGIEYPVIQGGMAWVADYHLAAAVSNAGGLGLIAAGGAPAEWVREQIRETKKLTDKPFGVNIMLMNPEADKIAKQLAPHLPVVESENLDSIVPSAIVAKGKRADHDIQAIWENNCALWKKIKEHFEACKAYEMSCDRYEGLHAADEDFKRMLLTLKEEYYAYKQAMDVYDHAKPGDAEEQQAEEQPVAAITSKQIGNARSYITKNLDQLIGLTEAGNTDKADALRAKVNERVQLLITAKAEITADTIAKLQQAGINMEQQASADGEEQPESAEEEVTDEGEADTASPETAQAE